MKVSSITSNINNSDCTFHVASLLDYYNTTYKKTKDRK